MESRSPRQFVALALVLVGCEKSPREVAQAYADALEAGNAVQVCSFVAMPESGHVHGCVAFVEESEAMTSLFRAGLRTYGVPIGPCGPACAEAVTKHDPAKAELIVSGDRATLSWGHDAPSYSLVRRKGSWKIDWGLDQTVRDASEMASIERQSRRATEAARETTREIRAGKYASGGEAWQAFENRIQSPEERNALIAAIAGSGGSGTAEGVVAGGSSAAFADTLPFFVPVYTATPRLDGGSGPSVDAGSQARGAR
ncbi:MAG: hypothetical protein QM765_07260 [Myxococcales bacterium]